jgi:hypothetical protein
MAFDREHRPIVGIDGGFPISKLPSNTSLEKDQP